MEWRWVAVVFYMTVQGMMQQEQSSPHQQGSFTLGVMRFAAVEEVDVADEVDEGVERAVVVELVVSTC